MAKNYFYLLILSIVLLPSLVQAVECAEDGTEGSWKLVKNREWNYYYKNPWPTDYSCDMTGKGTLTYVNGNSHIFELRQNGFKAQEYVDACYSIGTCGVVGATDCSACSGHFDPNRSCFKRVAVGCLSSVSDLPDCKKTTCDTNGCIDICQSCGDGMWYEHSRYGVMTCGLQSYCISPVVTARKLYQWVCNNCSTQHTKLINDCGGIQNIEYFDNATCNGKCKLGASNNGPPQCPTEKSDGI